ncbi:MFS family permease [Kitasatospora sp. MAP12-15]|uniref:MFS transporter n=1 Tax=unclassified Kitasatospora TaxID=2633591 RepID=UPI0024733008|nr:MFS transporter [Kitasatospora sp. MAP12-44]MDH6111844.1 MFS family permease [Kitasatospora sp. MAP12-44]
MNSAQEQQPSTARPDDSTRALLRSRPLRLLFLARSSSVLGDMVAPVALVFAVLSLGAGASGVGLVLAARALPSVALVLIGGVVGDRYPRRTVMAWSNLAGFVTQTLTGVLILLHHAPLWTIALLAAGRGATGSFFNPASTAAIAEVAPADRQRQTYSLFSLAGNTAEVAGPMLAAGLLTVVDPGWLLVADGTTFLVSALLITAIGPMGQAAGTARGPMGKEIMAGLRCVTDRRWLTALIASASVFQLCLLSALNVLGPIVAQQRLGGASSWAVIVAALGAGGLCGTAWSLRMRMTRPLLVGYLSMLAGAGPTLLLLAVPAPLPVLAASEFVSGVAIAVFGAVESAAIAKEVPRDLLSRVDAVNRFGSMALRPLGMAVVGPIAVVCGMSATLVCAAVLSLLAMVVPLLVKDVRSMTG